MIAAITPCYDTSSALEQVGMNQRYYGDNLQVLREHIANDAQADRLALSPLRSDRIALPQDHVREREKAEIALFISLEQPTPAMVKDAASVGSYESVAGKKFARVQLLTIDGLLNGTQCAEQQRLI